MTAQVIVPLPIPTAFTYHVPADLGDVIRGSRVRVPFGPRTLTGTVVATGKETGEFKDIIELVDPSLPVTEDVLRLTRWISTYYLSSWGEAMKAAVPPGSSTGASRPKLVTFVSLAPGVTSAHEGLGRSLKQQAVVEYLESGGLPSVARARIPELTGASSAVVTALLKKGLLVASEREVLRLPGEGFEVADGPAPEFRPFPDQTNAINTIADALGSDFRTFLLHGVTGSGKTRVYIEALKRVLDRGESGIVLVPEIALTPQTVRRFQLALGDVIAVQHSHMSAGERYDSWRMIRSGKRRVVIGARSAILAPLENLGIIIVDEEHEASYKQVDPAPRYHARDVAVMRAQMNNCICVLGSATPSLESIQNARNGKYELITMPTRVPDREGRSIAMPAIRVVDMALEKKKHQLKGTLCHDLREAIEERLAKKEQVILLQNRRGYAPVLQCDSCGWSPGCPNCSVTMTVHSRTRDLRCHYCGWRTPIPRQCGDCRSQEIRSFGAGTQHVEEELTSVFPTARVLRMDMDTTRRKSGHARILAAFGKGDADILVGTQMVAKGLDFERVTLVGIVNADAGLLFPDFRASERTFQLIMQVSGRAGRAELPGEVILQTKKPDYSAIRFAVAHDFAGFVEDEMLQRSEMSFPPYARLVRAIFKGPDANGVGRIAKEWIGHVREMHPEMDIWDPVPAFIERVKQQYRYHTIARASPGSEMERTRQVLQDAGKAVKLPKGYRITLDVDPVSVL